MPGRLRGRRRGSSHRRARRTLGADGASRPPTADTETTTVDPETETLPNDGDGTGTGESGQGGAGDEQAAETLALFTGKNGTIAPRMVRVPAFISIRVELRSADGAGLRR